MKYYIFSLILLISSIMVKSASAQSATSEKILGIYQGAPGTLPVVLGNGSKSWITGFPAHPILGQYDTAGDAYINWSLDKMAEIGIDFIILDESNGIHLIAGNGRRVLEESLLRYLDIADSRISQGIPTPKISLMTPLIGLGDSCGATQQNTQDGCLVGELDWIYQNLVNKNGNLRPSWFYLDGKPFIGIYSVRPFTPTYSDSRYNIRHICNAVSGECNQAQKDNNMVWFWTAGSDTPYYSTNSKQITIENGFDNKYACQIWGNPVGCLQTRGFTKEYYESQWDFATSHNPRIIVITSFGGGSGVEGGQIEQRTDFAPVNIFEDITKNRATAWKQLSTKPGDLNNDGRVDIFDFNLLITNFANRYSIFDFNNIVANYGK